MIFESSPWREELVRHVRTARIWFEKSNTARGYFQIEKAIFLSAYVVRKLIENRKVTDRIKSKSMKTLAFKPFRSLSDRVSRFSGIGDISKEYNLAVPQPLTLSLFDLASEIMHSYVLELEVDEDSKLSAFYVNSYRNQDGRLLRIDVRQYFKAVELVANDHVQEARIWKDPRTGRIRAELK